MLAKILIALIAFICFYFGLRLLIGLFPSFFNHKKIREAEDLISESSLRRSFTRRAIETPQNRVIMVASILTHLNLLSNFIAKEQMKKVGHVVRVLDKEIETVIEEESFVYCAGILHSMKNSLMHLAEQNHAEFDFKDSLQRVEEIKLCLKDGLTLLSKVETECRDTANNLKSVDRSDPEVSEIVDSLNVTFNSIVKDLGQTTKFRFEQLTHTLLSLVEIQNICNELSASSSSDLKDDWIDCYAALGIDQSATQGEIKKAFRQKMFEVHPDKKQEQISKLTDPAVKAEVERIFNQKALEVNQAYKTLVNQVSREIYDVEYQKRNGGKGHV